MHLPRHCLSSACNPHNPRCSSSCLPRSGCKASCRVSCTPPPRRCIAYRGAGGGGGVPCGGIYESTNSGATKSVPLLKKERTNYVWLTIIAHEKQWAPAVISWWTLNAFRYASTSALACIQILWHGRQVVKAMPCVYPHKSLKTPNKLRIKIGT